MKKTVAAILTAFCLLHLFAIFANAEAPSLSAKSAVLVEAQSGKILYMKNATQRLPMASTTKIMTALVAIESGDIDRQVRIDDRAIGVEGSSIYMTKGEVLTMRQLIYALMLSSANDAAAAIAYEISESIYDFAQLMNEKARSLGLSSTNFTNPHGLHDEEHYTTAHDLAIIAKEALNNRIFAEICSSKSAKIPLGDGKGTRYLTNHNKLLKSYEGCIGVKTGFTKASGRCLVSAAKRGDTVLIAVTLNAPDDWRDHKTLLDFGFANYERIIIAEKGEFTTTLGVCGGSAADVILTNTEDMSVLLPKSHGEICYKIEVNRPIFAPVKKGAVLGTVRVFCDGKEIAASPLTAFTKVDSFQIQQSLWERLNAFKRKTWKK